MGPEQATAFEREVLLLHFDVDTVDFTDAPLSENTGRNEGLPLDIALRALAVLASAEHLSALTVTELNPLHGDEDGRSLERFVDGLAGCL
jgi:arginase